jgi:putative FmdB family regulatory protein
MPIYEYGLQEGEPGCAHCRDGFEQVQGIADDALTACPKCGAAVKRLISAPAVGRSQSSLDDRAKSAGFHKLTKLGKGEYEKQY